jgi:acyl carrier protein
MKEEIIEIIFDSIDEVNQQNESQIPKDIKTKLFGSESDLDSLGLVNLIVSIEENINNKYNASITIADEKAMSQKHSPFRSVDVLAIYILDLLNNK